MSESNIHGILASARAFGLFCAQSPLHNRSLVIADLEAYYGGEDLTHGRRVVTAALASESGRMLLAADTLYLRRCG